VSRLVYLCFLIITYSVLFIMFRTLQTSPLFPYTTLFRSPVSSRILTSKLRNRAPPPESTMPRSEMSALNSGGVRSSATRIAFMRSEEHTSELQSRENLVCRLLLEKKKINQTKKSQ